jgi:putative phosphoesterase
MKIVVMSDTHLDHVTDEFEAICAGYCSDADVVVHLGDMARSPVLDFLEQYPLQAVAGNMDDQIIQARLPAKKVIDVAGCLIGIIHGWGSPYRNWKSWLREEFSGVNAILFGHSHLALQAQENGLFWFNPGSVFAARGGSPRSLGILHIEERIRGEIVPL